MAVGEAELCGREPAGPVRGRDERADEDRAPVAPVGACVHPDSPTRRPGDRARELEAAERGGTGAMQADRVRRSTARGEDRRRRRAPRRAPRRAEGRAGRRRRLPRAGSSRDRPWRRRARAPGQRARRARARATVVGSAKACAEPPVPIVVRRESATPSWNDGSLTPAARRRSPAQSSTARRRRR